jgi:hypothetical protein
MDIKTLKKYSGRKVLLILKNNFNYTTVLPAKFSEDFRILDKFGKSIVINADFVSAIREIEDGKKCFKKS